MVAGVGGSMRRVRGEGREVLLGDRRGALGNVPTAANRKPEFLGRRSTNATLVTCRGLVYPLSTPHFNRTLE